MHLRSVKGKRSSVQDSWLKEAHEMPLERLLMNELEVGRPSEHMSVPAPRPFWISSNHQPSHGHDLTMYEEYYLFNSFH